MFRNFVTENYPGQPPSQDVHGKGPVKLSWQVKITHSFSHLKSKLFHPIIFNLSL